MKKIITLSAVKGTELLTINQIVQKVFVASECFDMGKKYIARLLLSVPKGEQETIRKGLYGGAKAKGERAYNAMKVLFGESLVILKRKAIQSSRGKQVTTNPETIRKNLKVRKTKNEKALKDVVTTKEGVGALIAKVIKVCKISKALDPLELSQVSALLTKVINKANGTTVHEVGRTIHAAD